MKTNKRRFLAALTASTLALTPCFAAGISTMTAFAAGENLSITITPATNDNAVHEYEAYQVFTGTLSTDSSSNKVLSNIVWGSGIDSSKQSALAAAIKTDIFTSLPANPTAAQIAEVLKDATPAQARQFADLIGKGNYLSTTNKTDTTTGSGDTAEITGLDAGYYLVKDADNSLNNVAESAYTQFILRVVGDATANAKASLPTLTKAITSDNQNAAGTANTASIGDTVNYKLTSAVPDMTGYNKYFFVVNDTMSAGLTFDPSSVVVKIDDGNSETDDTLAATAYEVQTGNDANPYTFQIVLKNFIQYNTPTYIGKDITIEYSATLNSSADITNVGNLNTANLTYSNNPNYNYTGDQTDDDHDGNPDHPDEPGSTEPKGETPNQTVKTYTTAVKVLKVDESGNALTGAEFTLTGNGVKTVVVIKDEFTANDSASPAYYKLKDGTFTPTAPSGTDDPNYADNLTYAKTQTIATKDTTQSGVTATCEVGTDGIAVFQGLGKGTYTLTETKTPAGYNTIAPIVFTIGTTGNSETEPDLTSANWSITSSTGAAFNFANNMFETEIENRQGSTLPETGGIGTKLFYVFGSLFVVGAATFIVTKRRVGDSK